MDISILVFGLFVAEFGLITSYQKQKFGLITATHHTCNGQIFFPPLPRQVCPPTRAGRARPQDEVLALEAPSRALLSSHVEPGRQDQVGRRAAGGRRAGGEDVLKAAAGDRLTGDGKRAAGR